MAKKCSDDDDRVGASGGLESTTVRLMTAAKEVQMKLALKRKLQYS